MNHSQVFTVYGTPRPQGSGALMRSRTTGQTFKKQSQTMVGWRNVVVDAVVAQRDAAMIDVGVPVAVEAEFRFARPKNHSQKRRHTDGRLKSDGPDIDKLCRLILDALVVARVVDDDRQVCELIARKRYVQGDGDPEGVTIFVDVIPAPAAGQR